MHDYLNWLNTLFHKARCVLCTCCNWHQYINITPLETGLKFSIYESNFTMKRDRLPNFE